MEINRKSSTGATRHCSWLTSMVCWVSANIGVERVKVFVPLEFCCLCPVVVHNYYVVLDRHTHNTFTGTGSCSPDTVHNTPRHNIEKITRTYTATKFNIKYIQMCELCESEDLLNTKRKCNKNMP
jgi:hypothetical protein